VSGSTLTLEQRQMVFRLRGRGFSWEKIARSLQEPEVSYLGDRELSWSAHPSWCVCCRRGT